MLFEVNLLITWIILIILNDILTKITAYTSDVGEAFRPVVSPWIVRSAYAISWAYVLGDVSYEAKKDYDRNSDTTHVTRTVVKRALFQSVASMALPAFTIHQTGIMILLLLLL